MKDAVNFKGSVDRELLMRAKLLATKPGTSINALFNTELRYLMDTFEAAEDAGNQNYKTLLAFSLGRVNDLRAMQALGFENGEDLFLPMAHAHLPMPGLSAQATQGMVAKRNASMP